MAPSLADLSNELILQILRHLPLQDVLTLAIQCHKLSGAVALHLRLCKTIDLCEGNINSYMPTSLTDDHLHSLLRKCPHLNELHGLHPVKVERRRLRRRSTLTVPGVLDALSLCGELQAVGTCNVRLLEAILQHMPQLKILGKFQNRDGPLQTPQRLRLRPFPHMSSLHLMGVEIGELPSMPQLEHLLLERVHFTRLHPFGPFLAPGLRSFVMRHCLGPSMSLRYLPLVVALSSATQLGRLELIGVPLPGGLLQRAVEDSYRSGGFSALHTLVVSGCRGILEPDVGHLMVVSSGVLERVRLQPSLTRDGLFFSLAFARCSFPRLTSLHLGYIDAAPPDDTSSSETRETPSSLTDSGMRTIGRLFPALRFLSVSNCPHLVLPDQWSFEGEPSWLELRDLSLQRCHCLQVPPFALFLALLRSLEVVVLHDMFREPPKGCSHVGLSAGTGLGMSSAVVSNQEEHLAVAGGPQDFEEEEEGPGIEEGDQREQHIVVLEQEFFDEEQPHYQENVEGPELSPKSQDERPSSAEESEDDERPGTSKQVGENSKKEVINNFSEDNMKSQPDCDSLSHSIHDSQPCSNESIQAKSSKIEFEIKNNNSPSTDLCCSSKHFDPNQPSTSKAGNCASCACIDSTLDENIQNPNTFKNKRNLVDSEDRSLCHKKPKKEDGCLGLFSEEQDMNKSNSYEGPVTRNRSKTVVATKEHSSTSLSSNQALACQNSPLSCEKNNVNNEPISKFNVDTDRIDDAKIFKSRRRYHRRYLHQVNLNNRQGYTFVSQGTQATSQDIRRALRRHRSCSSTRTRRRSCHVATVLPNRPHHHPISARLYSVRAKPEKSENLVHKSTSTSDPLMEDDAVQTLQVVSETLISLSVVSCGISDIVIDQCNYLTHVEVIGCRILKRLRLGHCPQLRRIRVTQCPKMTLSAVLTPTFSKTPSPSLLCCYEPCHPQAYSSAEIEEGILTQISKEQSVTLCFDYSRKSINSENLLLWTDALLDARKQACSCKIIFKNGRNSKSKDIKRKFPYGNSIRKFHGTNAQDNIHQVYQIITNDILMSYLFETVPWNEDIPPPPYPLNCTPELFSDSPKLEVYKSKRHVAIYIPMFID